MATGEASDPLVEQRLLTRATGSASTPFEATHPLTAKGKSAAEYGEYECVFGTPTEPTHEPEKTSETVVLKKK